MKKNKNAYIQWATASSPSLASPAAPPSSSTLNCSPSITPRGKNSNSTSVSREIAIFASKNGR